MEQNKAIGIYDSGVGGLTVYKELLELLPDENYMYYGDTKNLPYGSKSKDEIIQIATKIFDFFAKKDIKALVMACNTTSAVAYEALKDKYDFRIYPLIQTVAKTLAVSDVKRLGVLATPATVSTMTYTKSINSLNSEIKIFEEGCDTWVKIVENSQINNPKILPEIEKHLLPILNKQPDKIILGCTHYPYLVNLLSKFADKNIFVNPAKIFADYIVQDLQKSDLINKNSKQNTIFYVTSNPEIFKENSKLFFEIDKLPILV